MRSYNYLRNRHALVAGVAVILTLAGNCSFAAVVLSRPALQVLIGGPGTLEDFETPSIGLNNTINEPVTTLNSTTIFAGQGPGLVIPGITILGPESMQWDGPAYYGSPSKELLTYNSFSNEPATLTIDFNTALDAFGVDLRAFQGFGATATMQVYAADDTTLVGTAPYILSDTGVPVFAGWENSGGIGKVVLSQNSFNWSPLIDNLEFGQTNAVATPEFSAVVAWSVIGLIGFFARPWMRIATS